MVEVRRRVIQSVSNSAVHVDKSVLLGDGVGGVPPEQHGGIPEIGGSIRVVEIFEEVAANHPVFRRVSADAVEVADTRAVVGRRVAGVLKPAVLDDTTFSEVSLGGTR